MRVVPSVLVVSFLLITVVALAVPAAAGPPTPCIQSCVVLSATPHAGTDGAGVIYAAGFRPAFVAFGGVFVSPDGTTSCDGGSTIAGQDRFLYACS